MKKNKQIYISIIIIGYNTKNSLQLLLESINRLVDNGVKIEVVYVDDGSSDGSPELFKSHELRFSKTLFRFQQNKGRVYARERGVEISSGDWLLFLNSNVVVNECLIQQYIKSITLKRGLVFAGNRQYEKSNDLILEKYLNHKKRGLNQFSNNILICYKYLLFDNCMIHKLVCKTVKINLKLKYYGGEELDFAYRVNKLFPNKIFSCKSAYVIRFGYPKYKEHCDRLIEFGNTNLKQLSLPLKKEMVKSLFFLKKRNIIKVIVNYIYILSMRYYNTRISFLNYYIIRLGMWSSILKGYYQSR